MTSSLTGTAIGATHGGNGNGGYEIPVVRTGRLYLTVAPVEVAARLARFFTENEAYFSQWCPPRPRNFLTAEYWDERCRLAQREALDQTAVRFTVFLGASAAGEVIGTCNLSQIARGAFHACYLGYVLGERHGGQGYMTEAVRGVVDFAFHQLHVHRIMANHLPENVRSAALLARVGFRVEGFAPRYLYVGGAWRDHVLTALTHPDPELVPTRD